MQCALHLFVTSTSNMAWMRSVDSASARSFLRVRLMSYNWIVLMAPQPVAGEPLGAVAC